MRLFVAGLCVCGVLALVAGPRATGQDKGNTVKVGDKAPAFQAKDEEGKTFKSSDVVGKKILVLYFYPADFTGGCTKQACSFRDDAGGLAGKDVMVVGVSGDSVKTHKLFKNYHNLNFPLLADENGEVAKKFGVPVGKGGKAKGFDESKNPIDVVRGVTIQRYTVIIDKEGKIAAIDQVKDAGGDPKRVAEIIKKLENK
jgi:peroxiredoxin Q/BCP